MNIPFKEDPNNLKYIEDISNGVFIIINIEEGKMVKKIKLDNTYAQ